MKREISNVSVVALTQAAQEGNAFAQFHLGIQYESDVGSNLAKNKIGGIIECNVTAREWYQRAALQGHPKAQAKLGWMYIHAKGGEKNIALGIEWLTKGAIQGEPCAQTWLGGIYMKGELIEKDETLAVKWYMESAKANFAQAQQQLTTIFMIGDAYGYYRRSLSQLHQKPSHKLPEGIQKEIEELKGELGLLKELYAFYSVQSQTRGFQDSLGENPYLHQLCANISSSWGDYLTLLEGIDKPGFLVSALTPRKKESLSLHHYIPGSSEVFVCLTDQDVLGKVKTGQLQQNIQKLNTLNSKVLQLIGLYGRKTETLQVMLNTLELSNKEMFNYIYPFFEPYVSSDKSVIISVKEVDRIEEYLNKMVEEGLPTHSEYADSLNERVFKLLVETVNYRNRKVEENYLWFFKGWFL
jgi:hypothetical protein